MSETLGARQAPSPANNTHSHSPSITTHTYSSENGYTLGFWGLFRPTQPVKVKLEGEGEGGGGTQQDFRSQSLTEMNM